MTIIYTKEVELTIEVVGVAINCACMCVYVCVCSLPGHCKTNVINYLYAHTVHFLALSLISIIKTASQDSRDVDVT